MQPPPMPSPPFPPPPQPSALPGSKAVDWGQFLNDLSVFLRAATYALVEAAKRGAGPLGPGGAPKPPPPPLTPDQIAAGFTAPPAQPGQALKTDPKAPDWVG